MDDTHAVSPLPRSALPRLRIPILVVLLISLAAGCDRRREEAPRVVLTVSAAASLREALEEVEAAFEKENPGVDVRTNFGASGALRQQIEQGAPVDVFISAAEGPMDGLQEAGLIDPRSRRVIAGNALALIVPAAGESPVRAFADLAAPAVRRVALGAPASVPAGEYADEVLRALGIGPAVAPKAVYAQNVRQVLSYVESGNVDAGVVYRTDAAVSRRVRVVAGAPPGTHRPITYPAAVVARTARPEQARAYLGFVLGPRGCEVLRRRGFVVE